MEARKNRAQRSRDHSGCRQDVLQGGKSACGAVRAENPVHGSDQHSYLPSRPAVMIIDHVVSARAWRLVAGFARGLPCDDFRLAGLKLIFLIVTRAVSVLGLSRRRRGGRTPRS